MTAKKASSKERKVSSDTTTLTLRDTPLVLIEVAKRITGKATASQAILASVAKLESTESQLVSAREENIRLRENLQNMQNLLRQLQPLCSQIVEMVIKK